MGFIEDMKWWHWIVISLIVGAAFAYVHSTVDVSLERTVSPQVFENLVMAQPDKTYGPMIQDIMVYPPETNKVHGTVQYVTFKYLDAASLLKAVKEKKNNAALFQEGAVVIQFPFGPRGCGAINDPTSRTTWPGTKTYIAKPGDDLASVTKAFYGTDNVANRDLIKNANFRFIRATSANDFKFFPGQAYFVPLNPSDGRTIRTFLDEARAKPAPWIKYRFAWWHIPNLVYPIWMGGSFLLIGIIWPGMLRILATGGLGRAQDRADYDLSRFAGGNTPAPLPAAATITADDTARLRELEASLEASLRAGATATAPVAEAKTEAPIKQLKAEKPAPQAPAPAEAEKPKNYQGEYYPVVRSTEKKS